MGTGAFDTLRTPTGGEMRGKATSGGQNETGKYDGSSCGWRITRERNVVGEQGAGRWGPEL